MHSIRLTGGLGSRWRSLGGAHCMFVALGVGIHRMHCLGVQGDRLRGLGGAHRKFLAVGVGFIARCSG